jgi:hypothetical protein
MSMRHQRRCTTRFNGAENNTRVELSYSVGGFIEGGFEEVAPAVEEVLREQFDRLKLFVETGKPTRGR